MFISEFDKSVPWSEEGVNGIKKYLDRVWRLQEILVDGDEYSEDMEILMNQTIKKVSDDIEAMKFNTAISQLMILLNEFNKKGSVNKKELETYLILLTPFAPHISEEMWSKLGNTNEISISNIWPSYDESKLQGDTIEVPVQVNGKVRGKITVSQDASKEEIIEAAQEESNVKEFISGKEVVKVIYVPGKILNIVVKG